MGILCPATVRPAPIFVFLHGGFAVKQGLFEGLFAREVAYV